MCLYRTCHEWPFVCYICYIFADRSFFLIVVLLPHVSHCPHFLALLIWRTFLQKCEYTAKSLILLMLPQTWVLRVLHAHALVPKLHPHPQRHSTWMYHSESTDVNTHQLLTSCRVSWENALTSCPRKTKKGLQKTKDRKNNLKLSYVDFVCIR